MNNTLLTTDEGVLEKIAAPSIEYCNKLKLDDEAFLKYLEVMRFQPSGFECSQKRTDGSKI